jgi:hypothetical protein
MTIELTDQQQQARDALRGTIPRVIDPRTSESYVLIPEEDYQAIHDALEDDRQQRAIRSVGLRNAIGRMGEQP